MAVSAVTASKWSTPPRRLNAQLLLAFFAIYLLWGSTYFAIRVAVETVPPLFAAGIRFAVAGAALLVWSVFRGVARPSAVQWRNLIILGALMFLGTYSGLFWAERSVPSGVASVLVATIPVWTALFEIFIFKREKLRLPLVAAIAMGLTGVVLLALHGNGGRLNLIACLAILGGEVCWSLGTALSKGMALPQSKFVGAGWQMFSGGVMLLFFSAAIGELRTFPHVSPKAAYALVYLIVAGSILAFTAFVWLLSRMPATTVSSYAYVNPVIALGIGHWLGQELVDVRTLIGVSLVLTSVLLLLVRPKRKSAEL